MDTSPSASRDPDPTRSAPTRGVLVAIAIAVLGGYPFDCITHSGQVWHLLAIRVAMAAILLAAGEAYARGSARAHAVARIVVPITTGLGIGAIGWLSDPDGGPQSAMLLIGALAIAAVLPGDVLATTIAAVTCTVAAAVLEARHGSAVDATWAGAVGLTGILAVAMADAARKGTADAARRAEAHRALEAQLNDAQRMEAIGRLAGGIAHDFNNFLTVILSSVAVMQLREDRDEDEREDLKQINDAGRRAAAMVRDLLAFGRRQARQPRALDVNDAIATLHPMLGRLVGENVRIELALDPTIGAVIMDPGQLDQVLINLVANARDAMRTGGTVTVRTRERARAADRQREVEIVVQDTGEGMGEDTMVRVFEPFFTTKRKGSGTGLGLATVKAIVDQSGGAIDVASTIGEGTAFHILLPRIDAVAQRPAPPSAPPARSAVARTILLVEDDAAVRRVLRITLERARFEVHAFASGAETLGWLPAHVGPIDLLLTDVIMPGIGGADLARRARALRPDLPVIFMSGYPDDALGPLGVLDPGVILVPKPITEATLLTRIGEVLNAGGAIAPLAAAAGVA